jgi:hypothetical protein
MLILLFASLGGRPSNDPFTNLIYIAILIYLIIAAVRWWRENTFRP